MKTLSLMLAGLFLASTLAIAQDNNWPQRPSKPVPSFEQKGFYGMFHSPRHINKDKKGPKHCKCQCHKKGQGCQFREGR